MKKVPLVLALSLVLAGLAFAPRVAVAGDHFHRGFHGGAVFVGRPFIPHHHVFPHRFFVGPVFVRPFVPFGVVAVPVVVSSPAVVYTPPAVVYSPPPVAHAVPQPPAMSTVIQYPHGRYELRGDGVTTPYMWVWIPNPPPAPPSS